MRRGFSILIATLVAGSCMRVSEAKSIDELYGEIRQYCSILSMDDVDKYCKGHFYCGDGGCDAETAVVIVEPQNQQQFKEILAELPINSIRLCDRNDPFEGHYYGEINALSYVQSTWMFAGPDDHEGVPGWKALSNLNKTEGYIPYCIKIAPSHETMVVFELSRRSNVIVTVARTGGEAGLPPEHVALQRNPFARSDGVRTDNQKLYKFVSKSFKEHISRIDGTVDQRIDLSVIPKNGMVVLSLTGPGSILTGTPRRWERAELYVYVSELTVGESGFFVSAPITQIKNWPEGGRAPTSFNSVDFDEGFQHWIRSYLGKVADELNGEFNSQEF
jgi:hypothetical protein